MSTNEYPALKVNIQSPQQVPACFNSVAKQLLKARDRGMGASVRARCADEATADSWAAFVATTGVKYNREGNKVSFAVTPGELDKLALPKVAHKKGVQIG